MFSHEPWGWRDGRILRTRAVTNCARQGTGGRFLAHWSKEGKVFLSIRQWLVIPALIFCGILVAAFFLMQVGVANVVGSGQAHTEKTAVSTLRTLHWAQSLFHKGVFVDADADGVGEFGTMEQLAGMEPLANGEPVPAALVPLAGTRIEGGVLQAGGYCFRYELPQETDERERHFIAIAWPHSSAVGSRTYCISENEDILEETQTGLYIGCESGPPIGTCPSADEVDSGAVSWKRWRNKTRQLKAGADE